MEVFYRKEDGARKSSKKKKKKRGYWGLRHLFGGKGNGIGIYGNSLAYFEELLSFSGCHLCTQEVYMSYFQFFFC